MNEKRILYIPVEIKAREFLGKTLLAARAAERGWIAILGDGNQIRDFMRGRPKGAYIEMSIPDKKARRLKSIHNSGHRIANLCEEALVYADGRDYCDRKLGTSALQWTDRLLVVGSHNADHIRSYRPEHVDKLAVTGNPRFDILLPELRCVYRRAAEAIRERLGRFVLVNTNFTRANSHAAPSEDPIANLVKRGMIRTAWHAEHFRNFIEFQKRQMYGLQQLLEKIRSSGAVDRIVVRPHPVENHDVWREWAYPLNIDVRYEGSAMEWMLAAEAVIHPGCTTAMEGLMLDRPVFSYVPEPENEFITPAESISECFASVDELLGLLFEVRGKDETELRRLLAPQREKLGVFVANVEPPYAVDRIIDELQKFDLPTVSARQVGLHEPTWFSRLHRCIRGQRNQPDQARTTRQRQKFPGVEKGEIDEVVGHWLSAGALTEAPRIESLGGRLWAIH